MLALRMRCPHSGRTFLRLESGDHLLRNTPLLRVFGDAELRGLKRRRGLEERRLGTSLNPQATAVSASMSG